LANVSQLYPGEQLVGAYLSIVEDCDLVSYNQRSREQGQQLELDVVGVESTNGTQTVFACEVVTHLDGRLYTGTSSTNRWTEFGNESYQHSLEKVWQKFERSHGYVRDVFDDAEDYRLQLWATRVSEGYLTNGLAQLAVEFEEEHGVPLELVINEEYTSRIDELRDVAASTTKAYGQPGFRYLQILENLQ
jgi:hypothetical protein